jgi:uncharacterized membrane protein
MQPLGLPGFGGDNGQINVSQDSFDQYVNTLIQIAIGFAILLAVMMVIAGGVEYMGARSVTNKDDAKDRIGKAIGGLILALSAVVILQTINPNLVELKPLDEVNVDGEDINFVATDQQTGWCFYENFSVGFFFSSDGLGSKACYDSAEQCLEKVESYDLNTAFRQCFYYEEEGDFYTQEESDRSGWCVDIDTDPTLNPLSPSYFYQCTSSLDSCQKVVDTWESQDEGYIPDGATCENFGDGDDVVYNQMMQTNIINGSPSESEVRDMFSDKGIAINKSACEEVDPNGSCTNVGGLSQQAINGVIELKNNYKNSNICTNQNCPFEVTGGTSWWFHGDKNSDPKDNPPDEKTYHNPTGLGLPTGAIDLSEDDTLSAYINQELGINNSGCSDGNYYLNEDNPDHWHITFDKPTC